MKTLQWVVHIGKTRLRQDLPTHWALAICLQVEAYGPGLEKTGCLVNQPAEFTVSAKDAGKGPLKITAQVRCRKKATLCNCWQFCFFSRCANIFVCCVRMQRGFLWRWRWRARATASTPAPTRRPPLLNTLWPSPGEESAFPKAPSG